MKVYNTFNLHHSRRNRATSSYAHGDDVKLANRPKYIFEKFRFIIAVYGSLLFSFALTMSMINYTRGVFDFELFHKGIMGAFNLVTLGLLVSSIIYLQKNQYNRYEYAFNIINKNHATQIAYSLYAEEINDYTKLGVIIFGVVSIFYSIIASTVFVENFNECFGIINFAYNIVQASVISIEIIFIVKYNRLIMFMKQQESLFILAQVIITNIMMWVEVTIFKLVKAYHIKYMITSCNSFISKISVYFLPCFAEYLVVTIVVFYEILCRVGKISLVMTHEHKKGESMLELLKNNFAGFCVSCFLIFTTFELLIIVITMAHEMQPEEVMKIHLFEELLLYLMGITANCILFLSTKHFKYSFKYQINNIDSNLLNICTFAYLVYCVNTFIGSIYINLELLNSKSNALDYTQSTILSYRSATAVVEAINVILQTYIIQDGFHRCNRGHADDSYKMGRGPTIVLMGINVSLWLLKSFQLKKGDIMFNNNSIQKILIDRENQLTNFFLLFLTPLTILYRYHCTVCLSTMLTRMYEDERARFENLMRVEGIHHHLDLGIHDDDDDDDDTLNSKIIANNPFSPVWKRRNQPSIREIIGARKRVGKSIKCIERHKSQLKNLIKI